jgi:hypothetical protein
MTNIIAFRNSHNPHGLHEMIAYSSETVHLSCSVANIDTVESAVTKALNPPTCDAGLKANPRLNLSPHRNEEVPDCEGVRGSVSNPYFKESTMKERESKFLKPRVGKPTIVVSEAGPSCPRCGMTTQVRTHAQIGPTQLRQPFYYKRWFRCTNDNCITTNIMDPQYIQWNDNSSSQKQRTLMNRWGRNNGRR